MTDYDRNHPMPWALIGACCLGMFAATASGSTRSPFLIDIANDLQSSLPAVANLFGVTSVSWGIAAYLAGRASNRVGRRVFLIGSPIALGLAMVAVAMAQTYLALAAIIAFAGLTCGAFTASSMAEVSLRTSNFQRGRALGWVMSGQSLTLLIGVPLAAWLGAQVGWRGVHIALAGLAALAAFVCFAVTRPSPTKPQAPTAAGRHVPLKEMMTGPVTRLFIALIAERVCFGLATFYYPAYLRTLYDLEIEAVALPLLGIAVGNIAGTVVGGYMADHFPHRRAVFAGMSVFAGWFGLFWFLWHPGLVGTAILGILFSLFNALARPALMAAMADVPAEMRGVVMGLNSSVASIGWLTAALVGGWLYAGAGFTSFGPLMGVLALAAALVVLPDSKLWSKV